MRIEISDAQWLHEHPEVTLGELAELSGLSSDLLIELVDYGALAPIEAQTPAPPIEWRFSADCVLAVRTVSRLRGDFDLDANALSVAFMLIERIQELEGRVRALQCQVPRASATRRG